MSTISAAPARRPVTIIGAALIRAFAVGGPTQLAASSSGDHAIPAAIITGGVTLLGVLCGPLIQDAIRGRRSKTLARKDAEIRRLRRENARLKRDSDG